MVRLDVFFGRFAAADWPVLLRGKRTRQRRVTTRSRPLDELDLLHASLMIGIVSGKR
jgi:hypothetical protein